MARAAATEHPDGLRYVPDALSEAEERDVLGHLEEVELEEVVFHGRAARRTVRHFGYGYRFDSREVFPTDPPPAWLADVRDRVASLAEVDAAVLVECLVTRYPPGAGIGWHRDAPAFGSPVVGVSLGAPCRMRFQRTVGGVRRTYALDLAPRSVYVLDGVARSAWQHSIPRTDGLRYSITFRTLRSSAG